MPTLKPYSHLVMVLTWTLGSALISSEMATYMGYSVPSQCIDIAQHNYYLDTFSTQGYGLSSSKRSTVFRGVFAETMAGCGRHQQARIFDLAVWLMVWQGRRNTIV